MRSNPGLTSRFRYHINLKDYNPEELFQMFRNLCTKFGFKLEDESETKRVLVDYFTFKSRDKDFGNGRFVENFFATVKEERAELISEAPPKDRTVMKTEYILKAIEKNI